MKPERIAAQVATIRRGLNRHNCPQLVSDGQALGKLSRGVTDDVTKKLIGLAYAEVQQALATRQRTECNALATAHAKQRQALGMK